METGDRSGDQGRRGRWWRRGWLLVPLALLAAVLLVAVPGPQLGSEPDESASVGSSPSPAPSRIPTAALNAAEAAVRAAVEDRALAGAALAVGIGPRIERTAGFGRIGWRTIDAPVSPDSTMYDLASLTKAVATTTAVLLLADEGRIDLDEPVQRDFPEWQGQFKERVTWRQLLTHTSGLPGGANIRGSTPAERLRRILRTRITEPPGRQAEYTDLGFLVLWEAAERVAGEPLDELLERRVWQPLGMQHTRFSPGQECTACAPTLWLRSSNQPFRGEPNDLLARRLGGRVGSAGLFSTAGDLARFTALIAGGGELDGMRILREEAVRELFHQQPGAGRRTLGWRAYCPDEPPEAEIPCDDPIAFGHTGWTGTSLWIDPRSGVWAVLLTNRPYGVAEPERIPELRREVWEKLRQ